MKNILSTILLLLATLQLFADDGGTSNFRDWTYGNIYVKEPNDKIALRKELMEVDTDSLKATFVFENTTDEDVVVDCAFPIVFKTSDHYSSDCYYYQKDGGVYYYDMFYRMFKDKPEFATLSPLNMLILVMGKALEEEARNEDRIGMYSSISVTFPELKSKVDEKLRKWSFEEYSKYLSDLELSANDLPAFVLNGCDIIQDGEVVRIENVGMETKIVEDDKEQSFDLIVTLHFHHKLKFPKGKTSQVVVSHDIESFKWCGPSARYGVEYDFTYNISTGGTWKGDIESFVVMTPFSMKSSCTDFSNFATSNNIYYKKDYKPKEGEVLNFNLDAVDINWIDGNVRACFPKKRDGFSVKKLKASEGVRNKEALFDGDIYTYASMKDWKDSWFEFTLDNYVVGPLCVNGQCSNVINELFYNHLVFDGNIYIPNIIEFQDSAWNNANRIKEVVFVNSETSKETVVSLTDEYTALASFDGWNTSHNAKKAHLFSPGTYRMRIDEVYKGNKGQRTALSEMWFLPIDADLVKLFADDARSQNPIFQSAIEKYFSYGTFRCDWGGYHYSYDKLPEQGSKEKFFADSLYKYNSDFPYEAVCNQPYEEVVYNSQPEVSSENVETKETVHSGEAENVETKETVRSVEAEKKSAENSVSVPYALLAGAAVVLIVCVVVFILKKKKKE